MNHHTWVSSGHSDALQNLCMSARVLTTPASLLQAILALKERQGSSLIAIKKYIGEKHKVRPALAHSSVRTALQGSMKSAKLL